MAGFGFAQQFAAPDYQTRAQAGLPVDPSLSDDAISGLAAQRLAMPAPQAQPQGQGGLPDIAVSPAEAALSWLMHGGTPGEAAQKVRQVKLANLSDQMALQQSQGALRAISTLPPEQQLAVFLNRGEAGKALADRMGTHTLTGGQTGVNMGPHGTNLFAPQFDEKSGTFVMPDGRGGMAQTPSAGGDITAKDGLILSGRTGPTGQTYQTPQIVPLGSRGVPFAPQLGGAGQQPSGASQAQPHGLDPVGFFKSFVLPHEGGLNPKDLNGSPTKYGINSASNPGVDLSKLSPDDAAKIFADKYFAQSGAANLPPALAAVHADTSFINPKKAMQFLAQSGGDPAKYMDAREAWMNGLTQKYPQAQQYAKAWEQRNADLRSVAGQLSGGGQTGAQDGQGFGKPFADASAPQIVPPDDPAYKRLPPGTVLQRAPTGELSVLQHPEYDPAAKSTIRDKVLGSPEYTQAKAAMSAYQAMIANADKMSGPSAYSMLDTFARAINPGAVARPTVIQTIEANLGLPAQLVGGLESKFGQGNLPPQVRQQIIDAVVPFAQAHWDQANMINQANAALAEKHGFDPADVTAPLESRPERVQIDVPPPAQRKPGLYVTPKGPMKWTGTGWLKPN